MDIKKEKEKLGRYLDKINRIKNSVIDSDEFNFTELEILKNYLSKALEEVIVLNYRFEEESISAPQKTPQKTNATAAPVIEKKEEVQNKMVELPSFGEESEQVQVKKS